ncbi:MAG TPA: S1/P1 nuclease [Allosphingosinicella sp.]|jgi:hypothetical protein
MLAPAPAAAWWEYGHETVATIAETNLSPGARREVRRLLARSHLLETPTCPARTIEDASVWPDCIKQLRDRFSYASPWHYQNVDVCRPFDQEAACRDGNCVSAQIERQARLLADRALPERERVMALAFLVHFVGDLHQPLHAGDRGDLGGNRLAVSYGVIAGRTNLHSVWDGYFADRGISNPIGGPAGILAEFAPTELAAMRAGTVTDWARESWEASREFAYGTVLAEPCGPVPAERPVIGEETTRRLVPIVRRQVARGGMRLAQAIEEAFAPSAS